MTISCPIVVVIVRAGTASINDVARSFSGRTGVAVLAALLGPGLLAGLRPSDLEEVVGGRARPVTMPGEPGVERHGTYLMPTALVRHLTHLEVMFGRRGERADASGGMELAKADAWWAALALLGPRAVVTAVHEGSVVQAAGVLVGDIVVNVNGGPADPATLEAIRTRTAPVSLRVLRDGVVLDLELPAGDEPGWLLGPDDGTPLAPLVETGEVAGASGGLVIALAEIDLLTPGDLTGGHTVAATGTIRPDGVVGGVLAYEAKAQAVADAGAAVLFVSAMDADAVRALSPAGLEVIGVVTLDDAVQALCARGGSSTLCH